MVSGGGRNHTEALYHWIKVMHNFAAIGPEAGAIAEGSGGGDEPIATSSKSTAPMACR